MTANSQWDRDFREGFDEFLNSIGQFNLVLFGKTGAGKSTLVNSIFGHPIAKTGVGKPVTKGIHYYLARNGTLGLYDTEGFETGQGRQELLDGVRRLVNEQRGKPVKEQFHVAWLCVPWQSARFESSEAEFVATLVELGLPVICVVTQVPMRDGEPHPAAVTLAEDIARRAPGIVHDTVYLTNAEESPRTGAVHGIEAVLDATFEAAPDGVREALNAAQAIDLKKKRELCKKYINVAAAAAAAAAAVPAPAVDLVGVSAVQLKLMTTIAGVYALPVDAATLAGLAAIAVARGASVKLAASLVKLVPGVGTVAGGVINASVASAMTFALGWAWVFVCERVSKGDFGPLEDLDTNAIYRAFKDEFTNYFKRRPNEGKS